MKRRVHVNFTALVLCVLGSAMTALAQGEQTITIRRGGFDPNTIEVDRGTKVNFKHAIRGTMNFYCKAGSDTPFSAAIGDGETVSYTFQEVGDYRCGFTIQDKDTSLGTIRVRCAGAGEDKSVEVSFHLEGIDMRNGPFAVGNKIEFRNDSDRPVGLKALDGSFDTGLLKSHESYTLTANKAGEFEITTYMDGLPGRKVRPLKIECR